MAAPESRKPFKVVEICAGAGGQALGLMQAGFTHELAIELDPTAADTLRLNLRAKYGSALKQDSASAEAKIVDGVITGDVAAPAVWEAAYNANVAMSGDFDLLAGGVPCPPFSVAGKQLGAEDERDLFAWAVQQCDVLKPSALLLENVRGLSMPRFAGYRQNILDRLIEMKYVAEWRLLHASDFGVPQLRPRFVLVALKEEFAPYFHWPEPQGEPPTVGETLRELMGARGWEGVDAWVEKANDIAPTVVGGSKKHGGADLGPTRAKRAWAQLGVDAMGIANEAPGPGADFKDAPGPKLTTEMVQLLQGWKPGEWQFTGLKTSRYRQVGNAFPPPVAKAVGLAIRSALLKEGEPVDRDVDAAHDPIYRALRNADDFVTAAQIARATGLELEAHELERRISLLSKDFNIEIRTNKSGAAAFKINGFKAFVGQADHVRHDLFSQNKSKIS
ncbi:DNA cytosine methyltransferase [Lentzea sp. NBC_00516]|uniref:DNA cytosine methyltransferase n=1 Tax=Lentzea sp. NBC_00516 TaxID=2903582 RepID=UPI002E8100B4|nr:DNA (cytosine-5-)-methyltransferase [Lentzea sp. NBC_00516]WUD22011.1 DNA cytosine methyltransferase [Lentzea sp. NBC_00516]